MTKQVYQLEGQTLRLIQQKIDTMLAEDDERNGSYPELFDLRDLVAELLTEPTVEVED